MKNSLRALRRHHGQRLKASRRVHAGRDLSGDPRALGKALATACQCSCWLCGNPRRFFGLPTRQELRAAQRLAD
jgi:hypothetical protein